MSGTRTSEFVDAPLGRVFAYAANPRSLPECWPSIQNVKNVVECRGQRSFDFVYRLVGVCLEGHADILEFEKNRRMKIRTSRGIQSELEYTFDRVGDLTKVTLGIDYAIPNRVLAGLSEPILRRLNDREAFLVLKNLKACMEHIEVAAGECAEDAKVQPAVRP